MMGFERLSKMRLISSAEWEKTILIANSDSAVGKQTQMRSSED